MDWVRLAQNGKKCRAFLNTVIKYQTISNKMQGIAYIDEGLLGSEDGLSSLELVSWLVS